jgi:hypothetical protein
MKDGKILRVKGIYVRSSLLKYSNGKKKKNRAQALVVLGASLFLLFLRTSLLWELLQVLQHHDDARRLREDQKHSTRVYHTRIDILNVVPTLTAPGARIHLPYLYYACHVTLDRDRGFLTI